MTNNRSLTEVIGLIFMALTIALFFLFTGERTALDWWCLIFMLLAELGATMGLTLLPYRTGDDCRPMLVGGFYAVLLLYVCASVVVALLFMILLREGLLVMIAVQLLIIALAVVFVLVLSAASRRAAQNTQAQMADLAVFNNLVSRAAVLRQNPAYAAYAAGLKQLYEALRYSDHACRAHSDQSIADGLAELEQLLAGQAADELITNQIDRLINLLANRKHEAALAQRGKI